MILLFLGGCLAGTTGGLLGIGGGVILMPLLRFVVGLSPAHAAGTCIVAVFFTTAGGSFRHYRLGNLRLRPLMPIIAAGTLTTIAFSLLFGVVSKHEQWLDLGLGLVFSAIAVRLIIEGLHRDGGSSAESKPRNIGGSRLQQITIGGLAGALPGLLGIGAGAILNRRFTPGLVKVLFGMTFIYVGLKFIISSMGS